MRVIGIVTEVRHPSGLYMREGLAKPEDVAAGYQGWVAAAEAMGGGVGAAAGAAVARVLLGAVLATPVAMTVAAFVPVLGLRLYDYLFGKPTPLVLIPNAVGASTDGTSDRAILIPSAFLGGQYGDYDAPLFHGLFASKGELRTVMQSEGGNVDLVIVDQATANSAFRHFLGGQFSTGVHLPHPKDPSVLIPARSYAEDLLREVRSEWIQSFEALGAKRIVIGDSTTMRGKAGGAKDVADGANVGAEMRALYGTSAVDESTYSAGTFDPRRAVENRRWLRDFPDILNIVEGRIQGTQASWRRSIKVNAAFGVSTDALGLFKASLEGGFERTYDFSVEFHPKT